MIERLRSWFGGHRLLRRLPLLLVIVFGAWLMERGHRETVTVRYELADRGATGLRSDIYARGRLERHAEWHFEPGAPAGPRSEIQRLELPPGDYELSASALGSSRPDPRRLPFHVDGDGPHEVVVAFP